MPFWSATFRGKPLIERGAIGLELKDVGQILAGATVVRVGRSASDKRVRIPFGKANVARDHYRQLQVTFESVRNRPILLTLRCYDDAIAFRYELPAKPEAGLAVILDESTSFTLAGSPTSYIQYLENYRTSHEHHVTSVPYEEIQPGRLLDMPLTFSWPDGTYAAVTEAALRNYAGMSLMKRAGSSGELVSRLTPRTDGTKVVRSLPIKTPWRVVLVGDRAGKLLESNTLYCLNDPPSVRDTSWIKPGKITFSWWNGDVYDGKRGAPILSLERQKKYIDWCARNGIPTHSVIADETVTPWYHQSKKGVEPGPDTDVTRVRSDLDLAAIREYARSKGIRLWTWVHQGALCGRVDEAFAAFERIGWSGMMVDFFDHDDQETIEFTEQILKAAARHHIMIHFHGIYKPTGIERTYPNLMNHEGALNLEYLKWSDLCTPEHNLNMVFTRMIAGPMDYHLGGFRAVKRRDFVPRNIAPNVLGTRCHHLAMYVCFDNPNPMVADYPTAYDGQPGFDFLKLVPTYWDETRVLVGEVGEVLVTARRKGDAWYLGGMSCKVPRDLDIPLTFLGKHRYALQTWSDAPDAEREPNHIARGHGDVTSRDRLQIRIATDGGFVARLLSVKD